MHYYANGFNYKFIQAKDLEHCKTYADMCEACPVVLRRLIE